MEEMIDHDRTSKISRNFYSISFFFRYAAWKVWLQYNFLGPFWRFGATCWMLGDLWANRTPTESNKDLGNIWGLWNYCILVEKLLPSGYQTFIDGASRDVVTRFVGSLKGKQGINRVLPYLAKLLELWEMERSKFGDLEIYGAYHLFDFWPIKKIKKGESRLSKFRELSQPLR